jgi:hypothetical protein
MPESFAEHLSRFTPDGTGLDRDALLFAAGRASARPNRRWLALCGTLAASQLLTLAVLCWPSTPMPSTSNVVPMIADRMAPAPDPEEQSIWFLRNRDFTTESDAPRPASIANVVADEPPMHAFGALPPALLN